MQKQQEDMIFASGENENDKCLVDKRAWRHKCRTIMFDA